MAPDGSGPRDSSQVGPLATLVGAGLTVPCLDGNHRRYIDLDCAASTPAFSSVAQRVNEFLPTYSSVHRGAGFKSRLATAAYEDSRHQILEFCGRAERDIAIFCRNTTEAINQLAYRLDLHRDDVVVTTVVEHHANLLPWGRVAQRRWVDCNKTGVFDLDDVVAALDARPAPSLLAITGASNVTGWMPSIDAICEAAHERGVRVFLDAAQLAAHRPIPTGPDLVAFSGHKMYAPFGAGVLVGPRQIFETGEPFLAGGGAVDLVDLDEVIWTEPPEREEAGSPNVVGSVALGAAVSALQGIGFDAIEKHESLLARRLRRGLEKIGGVTLLGPDTATDTLAIATFTVEGMHHSLVAARLSAEWGLGVRHGCFCAHPYLLRLLKVAPDEAAAARNQVLEGDRRHIPGAVRASCGLGTTEEDVEVLLQAVGELADGLPEPVPYRQDTSTGDFLPHPAPNGWPDNDGSITACARG